MERLVLICRRRCLFAGHDQHVASEENPNRLGRDAADVDDDLDSLVGLDDVERRVALAGPGTMLPRKARRKIVEQAPDVIGELGRLAGGNEGELRHWPYVLTRTGTSPERGECRSRFSVPGSEFWVRVPCSVLGSCSGSGVRF